MAKTILKIKGKIYRKVIYKEVYYLNEKEFIVDKEGEIMLHNGSDFLIWLTAIPIIGTAIVFTYFLLRKKEERYEEV